MSEFEQVARQIANPSGAFAAAARVPLLGRILVAAVGLSLLALSLYFAPTASSIALAALGLGLPLFLLVCVRPELGLLAIVFLTSSFVPADIIDLRLAIGGGLDLRDLALLGMLGLLGLQGLARKRLRIPWWPVGVPLLGFLGSALLSALYALFFQNVEPNWALSELRGLAYYAVFFIAGWAVTRPHQLTTVLVGLFTLADLTAGIVIAQEFLGTKIPLLTAMSAGAWRLWPAAATSGGFGTTRVIPPGHVLMYFMMIMAFCGLVAPNRTWRQRGALGMQFGLLNLGLLFTYTRAQWVASAIALGQICIILLPANKVRFARVLIAGVLVLLLAHGLLGAELQESMESSPGLKALGDRVLSLFRPSETLHSLSIEWRLFETREAVRSIQEHPLLGVGLGNSYRSVTTLQGEARGQFAGGPGAGELSRFTRFLHSSYLSIAVHMGLPALCCFLWFCAAFLVGGWRLYKSLSASHLDAVVLAILAGFLGMLGWSVFHTHLVETPGTAVAGLMVGLVGITKSTQVAAKAPAHISGRAWSPVPDGRYPA
jgi:hypothetical protein